MDRVLPITGIQEASEGPRYVHSESIAVDAVVEVEEADQVPADDDPIGTAGEGSQEDVGSDGEVAVGE